MISTGHTVSAAMIKSVRYDAVKDFAPVALVADSAFVVVARKDFDANDIKGLVALAKASPGKLNFGSVGVGSTQHMAGELLGQMTGIEVKHIPYRRTPGALAALLSTEIDYAVELAHAVRGQMQAGELKVLAMAGPSRNATLPAVPTGLRGERLVWLGLSGRQAAGDRRQDQRRAKRSARPARHSRPARQGRLGRALLDAGGIHAVNDGRSDEMERGARQGASDH